MSDTTKPAPESTAIPLNEGIETFAIAIEHITSVLVAGFERVGHPHAAEMKPLHIQLAGVGIILLRETKPKDRLARFAKLLDDYKTQLAGVGYRAFLDENILIVETVEAA